MPSSTMVSVLEGKRTGPPPWKNLYEILEERVKSNGSDTAIVDDRESLTFKELGSVSKNIACNLNRELLRLGGTRAEEGTSSRVVIGLHLPPSAKRILAMVSTWCAGAAYCPLDYDLHGSLQTTIARNAGLTAVISDVAGLDEIFLKNAITVLKLEDMLAPRCHGLNGCAFCTNNRQSPFPSDTAVVLNTSGSTGIPKKVLLTHASIMNNLVWQWTKFPYSRTEDRLLATKTYLYVDSVCEIFAALLGGVQMFVADANDVTNPDAILNLIEKHRLTRVTINPSFLKHFLMSVKFAKENGRGDCVNSLRHIFSGGEEISPSLLRFHCDVLPHVGLINLYGPTEATAYVTFEHLSAAIPVDNFIDKNRTSLGKPISNMKIEIRDKDGCLVEDGQTGEIWISGKGIPNIGITETGGSVLKSGDYGWIRDGKLYFEGRGGTLIPAEKKVDLLEIELTAMSMQEVKDAAAIAVFSPDSVKGVSDGPDIVLFYVKESTEQNEAQVTKDIKLEWSKNLPAGVRLSDVIQLEAIPTTSSGKTDRRRLMELYHKRV